MASARFEEALARLLRHEGGYGNHPSDPGGPTKFGITLADYRRYLKADATAADVRAMRREQARTIYRERYWDALRCGELPAGLDYALFDYGVNSGTGRAVRALQRLLGLAADCRMSDALLDAVRGQDAEALIARLCDQRLGFLKRLSTWPVFGKGWARRVADVRAAALAMAQAGRAPARRAPASDDRPAEPVAPVKARAAKAVAGGLAAAGAVAVHWAQQVGARPLVVAGIVAVTVALIAIGYLAFSYMAWRRRRRHLRES
jgi:lysozyme family protein